MYIAFCRSGCALIQEGTPPCAHPQITLVALVAYLLAELVRGDPSYSLTFDLCLVVYSLDGEEYFSE